MAAVPVGLVVAGALLFTGAGSGLDPFQNTADGQAREGGLGTAVTDDSLVPEASEDADFFASPTATPEREPAPSGEGGGPQSAQASSVPEDGEDTGGGDGGGSESGGGGSGGGDGGGGSGSGDGGGGSGGGDGDSGSDAPSSGVSEQVVTLVNAQRADAGCGPLRVDSRLAAAAQEHSEDMDRRDYMSHQSPEGEGPGDRADRHGYDAWGAENVAKGQTSPQQVMDAWMNSDGHRRNILNCDLVAIGVGESGNAWTQMFGWE
ncbi:CAP domain-containing protein [Nocardiopsis dassonvillei subsp. albirubida]|uniref:CAP domain-containing protein n=2 Tax=Nocardiopsis alborubida TaxID=146802 RepID=A0A7X6RP98_9ACTN|nr:CAP domain-containing protein [Nocardiopsis alborubida]